MYTGLHVQQLLFLSD